jgi:hypothetical protein
MKPIAKAFFSLPENSFREFEVKQPSESVKNVKKLKINFSDLPIGHFIYPHWNEKTQNVIELPQTIFNLCLEIPENYPLYISDENLYHLFSRINDDNIKYLVPNNTNPYNPNAKYIYKNELNRAWKHLVENGKIDMDMFKILCPSTYGNGDCSFNVFVGIINFIYPNSVYNFDGIIRFIEQN